MPFQVGTEFIFNSNFNTFFNDFTKQQNRFNNQLKQTQNNINNAFKPQTMIINAKDNATNKIKSIKNEVKDLAKVAAGITVGGTVAAGAGTKSLLEAGSKLERQEISIEHFVGVANKDKTAEQVKSMSGDYLKDLRKNADVTPFETNEVIQGGTRSLTIAGGDTKNAMELLKMAEDMAALNPEKTLSDAVEALADAKNGEFERINHGKIICALAA